MIGLALRVWRLAALAGVLMFLWSHLPSPLRSSTPAALARLNTALSWPREHTPLRHAAGRRRRRHAPRPARRSQHPTRAPAHGRCPEQSPAAPRPATTSTAGGTAAFNHMASLVKPGDRLLLTADPTHDDTDRYRPTARLRVTRRTRPPTSDDRRRVGQGLHLRPPRPARCDLPGGALFARTHPGGVYAACGDFHRAAQ
jgi:hypothetical protein